MYAYALRKDNPQESCIANLIEKRQKGLGSIIFRLIMGTITGIGGDDGAQCVNVAGLFGLEVIRSWNNTAFYGLTNKRSCLSRRRSNFFHF